MNISAKLFLTTVIALTCNIALKSQDSAPGDGAKVNLNLSSDIVSRYVWRGTDFGNSPAIQTTLSVSASNFEIGCWGSVAVSNSFKEVDLYAKYTLHGFSLTLTDYYVPAINGVAASPDNRFFVYADKKTAHTLEASATYKGPEGFPVWVTGGVFLYGNDKRWGFDESRDSLANTYYSSYIEAGYTFHTGRNAIDIFAGVTPSAGAYGSSAGLVNIGVSGSRKIKVSEEFEIPIKGSLIFNPQASQVFIVFGITI